MVVAFSSTAASVIVTPNSMVRMIVSATTDGGQAVASGKGHLGGIDDARVGTRIVTHREPTSAQRHEPHHRAIANYRCTLISEEPDYLTAQISAEPPTETAESEEMKVRNALAKIPLAVLRDAGLLNALLELANLDTGTLRENVAAESIDDMDVETLLRHVTESNTES
jgi:hypothetical protein